ncbi:hypothetical protein JD969_00300 [Planctomycetota bacterium]|nr:hypothetical protein JD969_00300 [Planctomycetota bacterium]
MSQLTCHPKDDANAGKQVIPSPTLFRGQAFMSTQSHSLPSRPVSNPFQLSPEQLVNTQPAPSPKPVTWPKLILLAFVRPIYAAERAKFLPFKILIPLTFLSTLFMAFITEVPHRMLRKAHEIESWTKAFFDATSAWYFSEFHNLGSNINDPIPNITYYFIFMIAVHLIFSLLLAPRVALPKQKFRAAITHAYKRLAILFPFLITCIVLFTAVNIGRDALYIQYWGDHNLKRHNDYQTYNTPVSQMQMEISTLKMKGKFDSTSAAHIELEAELEKRRKIWEEVQLQNNVAYKKLSIAQPWYLQRYFTMLFDVFEFPVLFLACTAVIMMALRNRQVRACSPWPACCEACGYHIFPQSTMQSTYKGNLGNWVSDPTASTCSSKHTCTECGTPVGKSIPPVHRVGTEFRKTSIAHIIHLIATCIKTSIEPIFSPRKFASRLRIYDATNHHLRFAFTLLVLTTVFVTSVTLLIAIYDAFWVNATYREYNPYTSTVEHVPQPLSVSVSHLAFNVAATMVVSVIWFLALYHVISFLNAMVFRVLHRVRVLDVAYKVSIYLLGSFLLMLIPAAILTISVWFEVNYRLIGFLRNDWNIGGFMIEEEYVMIFIVGVVALPAILYTLWLNYFLCRQLRYANA